MRTAFAIIFLVMLVFVSYPVASISQGESDDNEVISVWEVALIFPEPSLEHTDSGIIVQMEGTDNDPRSSALDLPKMNFDLDLPVGSTVESISIEDGHYEMIELPGPLAKNGVSVPSANDLSLWTRVQEDVIIPDGGVDVGTGTGIDLGSGETVCKVSITLFPCVPEGDCLKVLREGRVVMRYMEGEGMQLAGDENYDLLIICPDVFEASVVEYSTYRNQTGISTRVVSLSDITGDRIWNVSGSDIQEEMKLFIAQARMNWSIDYVMLVGDSNMMPVREIMVLDGYDDNGNSDGRFVPSDLYFGDLFEDGTLDFCDWNDYTTGDHDKLWGECTTSGTNRDGVDFYPDVIVGRVPAGTQAELDLMLGKARTYELSAIGSEWFNNATLCGTNTFVSGYPHYDSSGVSEGEYMSDLISSNYLSEFNSTKHYESLGNLGTISSTVNKGCGFFEMSDHGGYDGWGYTPSAAVTNSIAYNLDNGYKLPVVVLDACLTHGFDNENATGGAESFDPVYGYSYYPPGSGSPDCLGEQFHKAPNGGAVATYGCTRVGYGYHGSGYSTINSGYMNAHIHKAYSDGYTKAGEMLTKALEDYMDYNGPSGAASFKTLTEYVLLGDPTLSVGGINGARVEIGSEVNETEILPDVSRSLSLNMTNTGFLQSDIEVDALFKNGEMGDWILETDPVSTEIGPGELINSTLTITAPPGAIMGTERTVLFRVSSDLMSDPAVFEIVVVVGRSWGLDLESDPASTSSVQTGWVQGYLNLTNLGNGPEEVLINFTGLPEDWDLELGSELVEVDAFSDERIPFRMEIPSRCPAGEYLIPIDCYSELDPATASTELRVDIEAEYELDMEMVSGRVDIGPGENGTLYVNVINLGNSEVDVGIGNSNIDGWNMSLSAENITIGPFSSSEVALHVRSPQFAPARAYQITINGDDGESTALVYASVNVTKSFGFEAVCRNPVKEQKGTLATYFDIEIHNLGNTEDEYSLTSGSTSLQGWTFDPEPAISLGSNVARSIRVIFSNTFPLMGNYTFPVLINTDSGLDPVRIDLTVVVPSIFNFTANVHVSMDSALPGEEISGEIDILTESNCMDSYIVEALLPSGFTFQLHDMDLSLEPGENLSVNFTILAPPGKLAGPYAVGIRIISNGSGWNLTLTRTVHVEEVYGMGLELVSGLTGELIPGMTYQMTFRVANNGNTPDSAIFDLNCSGYIDNWVWMDGSYTISLVPGENRTVRIVIRVPSWNVTEGEYNLSLCMSSSGENVMNLGNYTMKVQGSKDDSDDGSLNWAVLIVAGIVAFIIILTVLIMGFIVYRRNGAVDVDEAGLEWESDEDDDDFDDEEDWEDWED